MSVFTHDQNILLDLLRADDGRPHDQEETELYAAQAEMDAKRFRVVIDQLERRGVIRRLPISQTQAWWSVSPVGV